MIGDHLDDYEELYDDVDDYDDEEYDDDIDADDDDEDVEVDEDVDLAEVLRERWPTNTPRHPSTSSMTPLIRCSSPSARPRRSTSARR